MSIAIIIAIIITRITIKTHIFLVTWLRGSEL